MKINTGDLWYQHVAWRGNSVPDDPLALIDRARGA